MKLMKQLGAACALAAGVFATDAVAGTVDLDFQGSEGRNVKVNWNATGTPGMSASFTAHAGRMKYQVLGTSGETPFSVGQTFYTFCTEIKEYAGDGTGINVTNDLPNAPNAGPGLGGPMSAASAAGIQKLFAAKFHDITQQSESSLSGDDRTWAAAMQVATWELVYELADGDDIASADVTDGEFSIDTSYGYGALIASRANELIAGILDDPEAFGVLALSLTGWQDQLYLPMQSMVVPLPAPIALAGIGLLGVGLARRRLGRILT